MAPVMDNGAMQIDTAASVVEDSSSSSKTTVLKIEGKAGQRLCVCLNVVRAN